MVFYNVFIARPNGSQGVLHIFLGTLYSCCLRSAREFILVLPGTHGTHLLPCQLRQPRPGNPCTGSFYPPSIGRDHHLRFSCSGRFGAGVCNHPIRPSRMEVRTPGCVESRPKDPIILFQWRCAYHPGAYPSAPSPIASFPFVAPENGRAAISYSFAVV